MDALLCNKLGDPTSSEDAPLALHANYPIPELKSRTSIRVRVRATSLNYANYLQILGMYQEKHPFPFILGSDYSGVVESVGSGVSKFRVGDRVCSVATLGSFAEFIVADESELCGVPDECDLKAAAALPVAYGTSHVGLVHRARLASSQVLLVLGAAGGVGLSAVQIGKIRGAIVVAVVSGADKAQFLKSLGVDHVVDLSKENVTNSVKEFLSLKRLKGVDVLYDPVGGELMKESLRLLNWGAQILVIGFASGEFPTFKGNILLVKNWTVHGLYWGSYKTHRPVVIQDSLKELLHWMARGLINVNISHTYSLSQSNLAFSAIKHRKAIGKVVFVVDDRKTLSCKL